MKNLIAVWLCAFSFCLLGSLQSHAQTADELINAGKNAMPPWRGQIAPDEIEALWAYVMAGETKP